MFPINFLILIGENTNSYLIQRCLINEAYAFANLFPLLANGLFAFNIPFHFPSRNVYVNY